MLSGLISSHITHLITFLMTSLGAQSKTLMISECKQIVRVAKQSKALALIYFTKLFQHKRQCEGAATSTRSVVKCWARGPLDNYCYEPVMTQRDPY